MTLIDELKRRHQELRQKMKELEVQENVIANDLLDLNIAIAALEGPPVATLEQPPAQPVHPDELRDAPPAASEESGDQSQPVAYITTQNGCMEVRDDGSVHEINSLVVEQTEDRASEDFTLLDPAVLRDESDPIIDAQTCEEVDPRCSWKAEPEIPEGWVAVQPGDAVPLDGPNVEYKFLDGETRNCRTAFDWAHRLIAYRIITPEAEPEPEGYAPVVDAEPVLDATELAQVTIDKVPPTAEVIKDQNGRAKFALFGGQTHEVVEPSNTEADFWARVLHPRKREEA